VTRLLAAALLAAALLEAIEHRGLVRSSGRAIPGAVVVATQAGSRQVTSTDESGRYLLDLAPGDWQIEVQIFGFGSARRRVSVTGEAGTTEWELELNPRPAFGPPAPPQPQTGFQSLSLSQQLESEILRSVEAPVPEPAFSVETAAGANESFLVSGSLSRGLEAARQEALGLERMEPPASPAEPNRQATSAKPAPGAQARRAAIIKEALRRRAAARKPSKTASFGNKAASSKKLREAIRGTAHLSLRNSALDARPYSLSGQLIPTPAYTHSRFGVALGGQLHIPKLLEGDRSLFFLNYLGTRSRRPFDAVATLPSPLERAGDFSQSALRQPVAIFDASSGLPFPAQRIPASRLSTQALGLLDFIPAANLPGRVQNYQIVTAAGQDSDQLGFRLSHSLAPGHRLGVGISAQRRSGESLQVYGFRDKTSGGGANLDLGWTHNLGPRWLHQLRLTFNRTTGENLPFFAYKRDVSRELGIRGTSSEPGNYGPPNLSFTNFGDLNDASPLLRRDQSAGLSEAVTLVRGRHTWSLGGEYRRSQLNRRTEQNARGSFTFSGLATSAFDQRGNPLSGTGFDFADFLLGLPQSSSIRFGSANNYFRSSSYSLYAQDDWKTRSNLTVNAGLRYEFWTPFVEKYDRMSNLDVASGFTAVALVTPGQSGPYSGAFSRALLDPDRNNFSPRAGLAWKPLPGRPFQVRAGYGWYYNNSVYSNFPTRLASQPPFAHTARLSTSLARPLTLADGFATAPDTRIRNTFAVDRGYRVGYAQTWNLAVQYELPRALVVELGYLGTKGTRLDIQRQPNRAAPGSPLTAEQRRQIGDAVGFTFDSSEGNSIYHAAQARLTRRFRKGFSANALYTWSKSIDNTSTFGGAGNTVAQDDKDLRAERGLSSFDQRHSLNLYYLFTTPTRGNLFRDWTFNGGLTLRSGQPFTARVMGNRADSGGTGVVGAGRADSTGAPVSIGQGFFNLASFSVPPPGRFGNAGRNTVPGPGLFSLNLSLGRSFRLGQERRRLDLRMESTNLTNHPSFTRLATIVNAVEYGLPTAVSNMRAVTATLRVRF